MLVLLTQSFEKVQFLSKEIIDYLFSNRTVHKMNKDYLLQILKFQSFEKIQFFQKIFLHTVSV